MADECGVHAKCCAIRRPLAEVLEAVVTAERDKAAALKLLKRIMKKFVRPRTIVTDGLRAYSAAMKEISNADRQEVGGRPNNREEKSSSSPATNPIAVADAIAWAAVLRPPPA
jgi:transposase-like protein